MGIFNILKKVIVFFLALIFLISVGCVLPNGDTPFYPNEFPNTVWRCQEYDVVLFVDESGSHYGVLNIDENKKVIETGARKQVMSILEVDDEWCIISYILTGSSNTSEDKDAFELKLSENYAKKYGEVWHFYLDENTEVKYTLEQIEELYVNNKSAEEIYDLLKNTEKATDGCIS